MLSCIRVICCNISVPRSADNFETDFSLLISQWHDTHLIYIKLNKQVFTDSFTRIICYYFHLAPVPPELITKIIMFFVR